MAHRLLLFCDQVAQQPGEFPIVHPAPCLGQILHDRVPGLDLITDHLMVEDKGRYLSLAVRAGRHYLPPPSLMSAGRGTGTIPRSTSPTSILHKQIGSAYTIGMKS